MKKWKLPSILQVESAGQFFAEMTELNKSSKTFSQRELAKFLGWPISYIPDIIKNRKPFTISRSLEFVRAFKVHPIDAEHFILMAVASQTRTPSEELKNLRQIKSPKMRENVFPEITVLDFEALLTCQAVSLLGPVASREKILHLLNEKDVPTEKADACLELLLQKEWITKHQNGYQCVIEKAYSNFNPSSDEMRLLQQAFLESAKSFFNDFFNPVTANSAFVVINKKRYDEVREKIKALKHWILEASTVDADEKQEETTLFQLELHLLPLFKPETLQKIRES